MLFIHIYYYKSSKEIKYSGIIESFSNKEKLTIILLYVIFVWLAVSTNGIAYVFAMVGGTGGTVLIVMPSCMYLKLYNNDSSMDN